MRIVDLRTAVADPLERRRLCYRYFDEVYAKAFPDPDQRESPDTWLSLMAQSAPPPAPLLHVIVAQDPGPEGDIRGGVVIEYFRDSRAALATYIAVDERVRKTGIGRQLLESAIASVTADNGGATPWVFAEVEHPDGQTSEHGLHKARARLPIIAGLGGRRVVAPYTQPALGAGQQPLHNLMLVLLRASGQDAVLTSAVLERFYREFFGSLGQQNSPELANVLAALPTGAIALAELQK